MNTQPTSPALDAAFEALSQYKYGSSRAALLPLDDALLASVDNQNARRELEKRLATILDSNASAPAKEYACLKLGLIGSAQSVSALAALLPDPQFSEPARRALEALPCPEAVQGLRQSLPKLSGRIKIGAINSLGVRRDKESVSALTALLEDQEVSVAQAAAAALGQIGAIEAAQALKTHLPKASAQCRLVLLDACLACAEHLLSSHKTESIALYKILAATDSPKHVKLAATRGLLLAAQTK